MKSKAMTGMPGMNFVMTDFHPGLHRLRLLRTGLPGHEGQQGSRNDPRSTTSARVRKYSITALSWIRSRKFLLSSRTPRSRAASSSSRCSSSPAHAAAAAKLRTLSSLPSCSATRCTLQTLPAAPPSGAVPHRQRRTPSTSRVTARHGQNSLFEDNAEFGLGMTLAQNAIRGRLEQLDESSSLQKNGASEELKAAAAEVD